MSALRKPDRIVFSLASSDLFICLLRAVTVADFYHRGGNGPTTAGGAVL